MGEPKLLKVAGGATGGAKGGATGGMAGGMAGARTIFEVTLGRHLASSLVRIAATVPGWLPGFGPVMERCSSDRVSFVVMERPCQMSESLKAGWKHLCARGGLDAIMISLADQPLVTAGTIDKLIRGFANLGKPICVPVFDGRRGRPVVIASGLGDEVLALVGDEGARSVLARHSEEIAEVAVSSDEVHLDFDRPGDLERLAPRLNIDETGGTDLAGGTDQAGEA
jgi:CTP:molybdopterin cytidylyltransferase MocA